MIAIQRKNKVFVKIDGLQIIRIPSQLYQVPSKDIRVFTRKNTKPITDPDIQDVVDQIDTMPDRSGYEIAKELAEVLVAAGYPAKTYVGWKFIYGGLPLYYSFVVLENHVLDFSMDKSPLDVLIDVFFENPHAEDFRIEYAKKYMTRAATLKNHEHYICGNVPPDILYVASPGDPLQAAEYEEELKNSSPRHPAYKDWESSIPPEFRKK